MLTPRNPTLNDPSHAPLPYPAPNLDSSPFPPLTCLSGNAFLSAPIDEEDDEDDPEEDEDHLDQEEEDEDDFDDDKDEEEHRVVDDNEEEDDEDEEEDDEDDEEEDEDDTDSGSFFQRTIPRAGGRSCRKQIDRKSNASEPVLSEVEGCRIPTHYYWQLLARVSSIAM
jgi:hypothetical protein